MGDMPEPLLAPVTRREVAWAVLLCALAATLFLSPALLTGRFLSPADLLFGWQPWAAARPPGWSGPSNGLLSDSVLQFEPWLVYSAARLHAGALPLWNPDNMLGAPFIGNMQSAVFYPLNWPYLLWPDGSMLALRAWLKLFVAALGMYLLARQVVRVGPVGAAVAAATFTFGGFLIAWLLYPLTGAVIWLPWLWWATGRLMAQPGVRAVAVLALVVALTLLAGQPEMAFHMTAATGLLALFLAWQATPRRAGPLLGRLGLWAAAFLLGALLAAIQILPFLEYLAHSAALAGRSGSEPAQFWLPFYLAWTAISPDLFGNPAHGTWWDTWTNYNEANSYSGIVPLVLAPFAFLAPDRRQRALAAFLLAGSIVAAGVVYHWPVVFDMVTALPLLHQAANQRLLVVIECALGILAALGVCGLRARLPAWRGRLILGLGLWMGVLLAVGIGVPLLLAHSFFRLPPDGPAVTVWQAALARGAALVLVSSALVGGIIALWGARPRIARALLVALPLLLVADLWQARIDYTPTVAPGEYFPPTAATRFLQQQPGPFRTVAGGWLLPPTTNLVYGLADLRGYDAVEPRTYHDLAVALDPSIYQGAGGGFKPFNVIQSPLIDLLNVRYVLAPPGTDPNPTALVDVRQEGPPERPVGEIFGAYRPGQTFTAGLDNLTAVEVFGATFGRPHGGRLIFHLKIDPAGPGDLATVVVDAATLKDDSWWTFAFPPIAQARGRQFYFYFEAPDVPERQSVTVYYTQQDPYAGGTRMAGGQPQDGDLVFRTLAGPDPADPWFARVLDGGPDGTSVFANRRALPRAWLVHRAEVVPDDKTRLARLAGPAFDRAGTALLDTPPAAPLDLPTTAPPGSDTATITRYTPEDVEIRTASPAASLLILADQAFPGWEARVDGQAVPILTADHALRAVAVPGGAHTVRFTYAPGSFRLGAGLTVLALVLLAGLGWAPRRRPFPSPGNRL
jgi:hypothetical protein